MTKGKGKEMGVYETSTFGLTRTQRLWAWLIFGVFSLLFIYFFRTIIVPYLVGMALAYFLDPIADWLENHGFKRLVAVTIITLVALFIFVMILVLAVPLAVQQMATMVDAIPGAIVRINQLIDNMVAKYLPQFADYESGIATRLQESSSQIAAYAGEVLLASTNSVMSFAMALVIIPIVAFYMLWSWDDMTAVIDSWVPRDKLPTYRYLTGQIDRTLAGFVRGQGTVCIVMAVYYSLILTVLGLNYGFIIGIIAGFLTFIPMVGGLVGGLLVVGVGFFQYCLPISEANWLYYALVLALYYAGQLFEGNILTPRLVGNSVGLHPVWVMFALSAGAVLAGLTGMLIAIPVAAVIGVLGRFIIAQYKEGPLYLGEAFDEKEYRERKKEARANNG